MTEHIDISYDFYIFYSDFISVIHVWDLAILARPSPLGVSFMCPVPRRPRSMGVDGKPHGILMEKKHWNTDMLWKKPWDCMEKPIETDFQTNPIEIFPTSYNIFGEVRNGDQPFGWSRWRTRSCWKLIEIDKYVELVYSVYSMWLYNNCYTTMYHIVVYIYICKTISYHIICLFYYVAYLYHIISLLVCLSVG